MSSKNDVTGDSLRTKPTSESYANNYDAIFRKPKETPMDSTEVSTDKPLESTK
jgi:hypothetical protein